MCTITDTVTNDNMYVKSLTSNFVCIRGNVISHGLEPGQGFLR